MRTVRLTFRYLLVAGMLLSGCSPAPRYTAYPTFPGPRSSQQQSNSSGRQGDSSEDRSGVEMDGKTFMSVDRPPKGTLIRGKASFYSDDFHGRKTSNGETFDMNGLSCAHRTLPFNTWLEVKNLANNRTVVVRVNDRGPFVGDRIIDLSLGAAREIRMVETGVQEVDITIIGYAD
jgi:rare lipoprotein A